MMLEKGFAWNGETYGSLSQVAKAMTGTSWNGHRFFGLRTARSNRSGTVLAIRELRRCDVGRRLKADQSRGPLLPTT